MIRRLGPSDGEELRELNSRFKPRVPSIEASEGFLASTGATDETAVIWVWGF